MLECVVACGWTLCNDEYIVHSQLKPSQVRGRKGNDGDMQGEEDDAGPAEPTTNGGKQLEDASQQSEVPSHEHPVSASRLVGNHLFLEENNEMFSAETDLYFENIPT